jgi:hypothetical protein
MITLNMIQKGYERGIIKIVQSPHNDGVVCSIGDNWFYFGGITAEECKTPEEYTMNVPQEDIVREIFDVLDEFRTLEDFKDEYDYYMCYLLERETYGCDICGKRKDSDYGIVWITSSYGVCLECHEKLSEEDIEYIRKEYE